MKKLLFVCLFFIFTGPVFARSGCCSRHGGVCGCGCCDGTGLSSTCAPYYPECNGGPVIVPTKYIAPVVIPTKRPITPRPTRVIAPTLTPEPTIIKLSRETFWGWLSVISKLTN